MKSQTMNMMPRANNMDLETFCLGANIGIIKLQYDPGRARLSYNPKTILINRCLEARSQSQMVTQDVKCRSHVVA